MVELLIVIAIIMVLITAAIPIYKTGRMNARETTVMREMQTIFQAQIQYQSQFGGFADSLAQLGPPVSGTAGPQAARLIPRSLASGEKGGYLFRLARSGEGFAAWARPKEYDVTGRRSFFIDENGVVHYHWGREDAGAESPEIQ